MSWSFSASGTPEEVVKQVDTQNSGLTDVSKKEWEEAKPALRTLVNANKGNRVSITANGHGSFDDKGNKTTGYCICSLTAQ